MGIRFTQPQGICPNARNFLNDNRARTRCCSHCGRYDLVPPEHIGSFSGLCGEEFPLYRYSLVGGGWAEEYVQEECWDSGPVIFLGLRTQDGKRFLWDNETINKRVGFNFASP